MNKQNFLKNFVSLLSCLSLFCSYNSFTSAFIKDRKSSVASSDGTKPHEERNCSGTFKSLKSSILRAKLEQDSHAHHLSDATKDLDDVLKILNFIDEDMDLYDVENPSYATLLYRMLTWASGKDMFSEKGVCYQIKSLFNQMLDNAKEFLKTDAFDKERFEKYSDEYQLNLLKSISLLNDCPFLDAKDMIEIKNKFAQISIENLKSDTNVLIAFIEASDDQCKREIAIKSLLKMTYKNFGQLSEDEQGREVLLAFARYSDDVKKSVTALRVIFQVKGEGDGKNFDLIAKNRQGANAIIAFAGIKVDVLQQEQILALKSVFKVKGGDFDSIAKDNQGKEALIAYMKLIDNANEQLKVFRAISATKNNDFILIAKSYKGIDALLEFAKIQSPLLHEEQMFAVQSIFAVKGAELELISADNRGIDAMITFARLSSNKDEQIRFMETVFAAKGGDFKRMAYTEQGVYALLTFAKIASPDLHDRQMEALYAIFETKKMNFKDIAENEQGLKALLLFSKLSGKIERPIELISAINSSRFKNKYNGEINELLRKSCFTSLFITIINKPSMQAV